jgi:hypothetical protein
LLVFSKKIPCPGEIFQYGLLNLKVTSILELSDLAIGLITVGGTLLVLTLGLAFKVYRQTILAAVRATRISEMQSRIDCYVRYPAVRSSNFDEFSTGKEINTIIFLPFRTMFFLEAGSSIDRGHGRRMPPSAPPASVNRSDMLRGLADLEEGATPPRGGGHPLYTSTPARIPQFNNTPFGGSSSVSDPGGNTHKQIILKIKEFLFLININTIPSQENRLISVNISKITFLAGGSYHMHRAEVHAPPAGVSSSQLSAESGGPGRLRSSPAKVSFYPSEEDSRGLAGLRSSRTRKCKSLKINDIMIF